jgi:hypothetical protein
MWPARYFAPRYFAPRYFAEVGMTEGVYFAPRYFAAAYFAPRYWPGVPGEAEAASGSFGVFESPIIMGAY